MEVKELGSDDEVADKLAAVKLVTLPVAPGEAGEVNVDVIDVTEAAWLAVVVAAGATERFAVAAACAGKLLLLEAAVETTTGTALSEVVVAAACMLAVVKLVEDPTEAAAVDKPTDAAVDE